MPATIAAPTAMLNLKTFQWRCAVCGDAGLLTRALRDDFEPAKKSQQGCADPVLLFVVIAILVLLAV